jgi:Outer membrane protein beta-barrel domain
LHHNLKTSVKKIIIVNLCFVFSFGIAHANIFSIGPRVGFSVSPSKVHLAHGKKPTPLQLKDHWGFHAGIFSRLELFTFYAQPEILLTSSGAKVSKDNQVIQLDFTQLSIPAMAGISFFGVVRAQIGPVFSLLLSAKEKGKDVIEHYSSMTVGWQGGLGFDLWRMVIDLKYEGNLSKFGNETAGRTNPGHAPWATLSVGINIL